jgi:hypothetical protein
MAGFLDFTLVVVLPRCPWGLGAAASFRHGFNVVIRELACSTVCASAIESVFFSASMEANLWPCRPIVESQFPLIAARISEDSFGARIGCRLWGNCSAEDA